MKYFIYCRKSTEDEDRQILSLESQRIEIDRLCALHSGMEIAGFFEEQRSAKTPGRPIFTDMMQRIENGEAEGIIAWHPDRLARNSVDGGAITYLLDQGKLRDLKFPAYSFDNTAQGKFMLQIMFSYSKYYVDSMSDNIRRGIRRKLELGIRPNRAPVGYKNDKDLKTIVEDPQSFPVIRRMWDLILTGCYRPEQIRRMAAEEWGYRTPVHKRSGGKPMALGTVYKVLSNPFYAGLIAWKGTTYPGKHRPMVTMREFERVQAILGRPLRNQPQKHTFAFTGLIRCGSCGCGITAENKINRYGSRYTYYHCTKRRGRCPEKAISLGKLEAQILAFLQSLRLPDELHSWCVSQIKASQGEHVATTRAEIEALEKAVADTERALQNLTDLRLRDVIADEEFLERREKMRTETLCLREKIAERAADGNFWFEPARSVLSISNLAVSWFEHGNSEQKRLILATAGSNLFLSGRILSVQAAEPFGAVPRSADPLHMCRFVEAVRTFPDGDRFERMVSRIKELQEFNSKALDASTPITSPTSPHPPVRRRSRTRAAFNKPVSDRDAGGTAI